MSENRIDKTFETLRKKGSKAFVPFVTAGDPDLPTTERIILAAEEAGADMIELGFPFSDPVADGPTIQASYTRVLERGQRNEDVFEMVESLRKRSSIPVVAMISYSLVYKMGFKRFVCRAREAGIDGATIPDLPIDEFGRLLGKTRKRGFHLICFVTPDTSTERREMVVRFAEGFIYYIAVRGITGERGDMPVDLKKHLDELKEQTDVPVAVGFGISKPEHAGTVAEVADGVIVGSAIVRRIHAASERGEDPVSEVKEFVRMMADATKGAISD